VIFLIGMQIWDHIRDKRGWKTRDRIWLFVLLTAAMLIKGPIVYAFILPGVLVFVWCRRKDPTTARGCGWWPWAASLAIFLVWVGGGIIFQHGFYEQVVMREFIGRFGETIHRPQPFYFYLPHLLHKYAPWSLFMIALAIVSFRWKRGSGMGFQPMYDHRQDADATLWLICWSLGGLLAMSLIPSKRVDRIFPVIPPLCLLLAAQIAHALRCSQGPAGRHVESGNLEETGHRPVATDEEETRRRIYLWTAITVAFSILFTGVYSISKVVTGYRNHRNALVVFGREVRSEAEKHHWRFEVTSASDEGMLLYLQRPHFTKADRAVAEWNLGNLDALVVPAEDAPALMRELHNAALSQLKSETRQEERDLGYLLITR
jgi:hypothetical protein